MLTVVAIRSASLSPPQPVTNARARTATAQSSAAVDRGITARLLIRAGGEAVFLHCLVRGLEVFGDFLERRRVLQFLHFSDRGRVLGEDRFNLLLVVLR